MLILEHLDVSSLYLLQLHSTGDQLIVSECWARGERSFDEFDGY